MLFLTACSHQKDLSAEPCLKDDTCHKASQTSNDTQDDRADITKHETVVDPQALPLKPSEKQIKAAVTQVKPKPKPPALYTVQLGAFQTEQAMLTFAEQTGLRALNDLLGHKVLVGGKLWFVITWGGFETSEQAKLAWLKHQENFPKVSYWVRSMKSLNEAKQQTGN